MASFRKIVLIVGRIASVAALSLCLSQISPGALGAATLAEARGAIDAFMSGSRTVILASRRTRAETEAFVAEFLAGQGNRFREDMMFVMLFPSGWYGVAIGLDDAAKCSLFRDALVGNGWAPSDSFCASGKKAAAFFTIAGGSLQRWIGPAPEEVERWLFGENIAMASPSEPTMPPSEPYSMPEEGLAREAVLEPAATGAETSSSLGLAYPREADPEGCAFSSSPPALGVLPHRVEAILDQPNGSSLVAVVLTDGGLAAMRPGGGYFGTVHKECSPNIVIDAESVALAFAATRFTDVELGEHPELRAPALAAPEAFRRSRGYVDGLKSALQMLSHHFVFDIRDANYLEAGAHAGFKWPKYEIMKIDYKHEGYLDVIDPKKPCENLLSHVAPLTGEYRLVRMFRVTAIITTPRCVDALRERVDAQIMAVGYVRMADVAVMASESLGHVHASLEQEAAQRPQEELINDYTRNPLLSDIFGLRKRIATCTDWAYRYAKIADRLRNRGAYPTPLISDSEIQRVRMEIIGVLDGLITAGGRMDRLSELIGRDIEPLLMFAAAAGSKNVGQFQDAYWDEEARGFASVTRNELTMPMLPECDGAPRAVDAMLASAAERARQPGQLEDPIAIANPAMIEALERIAELMIAKRRNSAAKRHDEWIKNLKEYMEIARNYASRVDSEDVVYAKSGGRYTLSVLISSASFIAERVR